MELLRLFGRNQGDLGAQALSVGKGFGAGGDFGLALFDQGFAVADLSLGGLGGIVDGLVEARHNGLSGGQDGGVFGQGGLFGDLGGVNAQNVSGDPGFS